MRKFKLIVRDEQADMKDKKRMDKDKSADEQPGNRIDFPVKIYDDCNVKSDKGNV